MLGILWLLKGLLLLLGSSTGSTFPHPLDEAEEARCLELIGQGDEAARDKLIEHNLRLVAHIVKKFDNTGEDPEDLISIGTIGLIKGINTYKQGKGTRLATYAARCIENEILMHLRSLRKLRGEVFMHEPIGVDREGNEISLIDVLGTEPDIVPDIVDALCEEERLHKRMSRLSRKERKILEMRYGLGNGIRKTQREIAWMLGISRSYVSRIEKRAVTKLCRELGAGL